MFRTCLFQFQQLLFVSISASLVCVPVGVTSSAVGIKSRAVTAAIKKYKSIISFKKGASWMSDWILNMSIECLYQYRIIIFCIMTSIEKKKSFQKQDIV